MIYKRLYLERGGIVEILEKLRKSYSDLYRRYLSPNRDDCFRYARTFPLVVAAMHNLPRPVLGPELRRIFRFEGPGRYSQSPIVPINQKVTYHSKSKSVIMPIEKIHHIIQESSYRILMNRCICRNGIECTHFPRDLGCIMLGEA